MTNRTYLQWKNNAFISHCKLYICLQHSVVLNKKLIGHYYCLHQYNNQSYSRRTTLNTVTNLYFEMPTSNNFNKTPMTNVVYKDHKAGGNPIK